MSRLADYEPLPSMTSWPNRRPTLVAPRASPAMARAHAKIEAQAKRAVRLAIKDRARAYALRPRDLDAICEGLARASSKLMVKYLASEIRDPGRYRWFSFGGEVPAINLHGAMLYARWSRRLSNRRK